ncbi:protein LATE ELONGATED HYPOCOTYL-like [Telopea speciosissima]|uniref:protein LATE ELONGATED HYPOCOTYL-like n=1 Tax=Telopea speciosissima TaxID=54955 RepID=UPI001CC4396F|nr:protein LATE ELONGATED HYPOCOTYL-like [Telopea speciosissima]XP_043716237.1 protein LATE ELONGATED HYPOCOTYL-like [Telopea speciosissima]
MDAYSSGEELIIRTRKPYTITKQRERWTEEEHNRFLEALKLYGRAWQRIEEFIGTKTAVQIRSHAQKFFSKLEKVSLIKGIPLGQALDIEIPPARPKRKPSNPYPRKTSTGAPQSSLVNDGKLLTPASHLHAGKQPLDLENGPPHEKPAHYEKSARAKETLNQDNCSEVLTLFHEVPCTSYSSVSKNCIPESFALESSSHFKEFVPSIKDINDQGTTDESHLTVKTKVSKKLDRTDADYTEMNNGVIETLNLEKSSPSSHDEQVQEAITDEPNKPEMLGLFSTEEMQTNQNFPRHVPLQFVDGISGTCMQTLGPDMTYPTPIMHQVGGAHGNPNLFTKPTTSASSEHHSNMSRPSVHQPLPTFLPPFTPLCNNQETYGSFLNFSATFSSLLVSTLLQNPAAHAAASLAASFWPCTNMEAWVDSSSGTLGGIPLRQISPPPSMEAVAAATVAAASAWWAAHGLLPLCPPLHTGFNCVSSLPTEIRSTDTGQPTVVNKDKKDNTSQDPPWEDQQLDPEFSEAVKKDSASKSPPASSSNSESGGTRSNSSELKDHMQKPVQDPGFHESNKADAKKQVDRSSCGSNTASSSEVETDAIEKNEKGEEELKEIDLSPASVEPNNRRNRSTSNMNESWKEVSEEGRLAFQALFSREVLPQSFSPHHYDPRSNEHPRSSSKEGNEKGKEDTLQVDLSSKTWSTCLDHPGVEKYESLRSSNNPEVGLLMTELGHARLKGRRAGFKPYKRCSLEAKEDKLASGSGQGEQKGPKRICLGGEAST